MVNHKLGRNVNLRNAFSLIYSYKYYRNVNCRIESPNDAMSIRDPNQVVQILWEVIPKFRCIVLESPSGWNSFTFCGGLQPFTLGSPKK